MSENQKEEYATARQEIEKLRSENSKLREDWLEATDALMSYTGLPGQMHRIGVEISSSNCCWSALPMRWKKAPTERIRN
jgi:hypothetical protein